MSGSKKVHELLAEIGNLHDKKSADYGRDSDPLVNFRSANQWGVSEWVGVMLRIEDKVRRLQTYATRGSLTNESARDGLIDLATYAVIALALFDEENPIDEPF